LRLGVLDVSAMSDSYFAHSTSGPEETWEPLGDHLDDVAQRAADFAAEFDSRAWGRLAGLWHDLGKYRADFQQKIRGARVQAPHAGAGAAHAHGIAPPLAFIIAGHHTGLANRTAQGESTQLPLTQVVADGALVLREILGVAPTFILEQTRPETPSWLRSPEADERKCRLELWTRFLFSALVDADRLATEAFYEPSKRDGLIYDDLAALRMRVDAHLDGFVPTTPVNMLRAQVLESCRRAAEHPPGLFSLTVPTGGGKTLASMSFALRHAERHGLRRVIVVAPYTSIIEQNAAVYRSVLGEANVIEHHSAIDEELREREVPERELKRRLAVENWDAPVVVTTAVQFFESLFSNEPSRCRKLHNIARSVVIVDEAQTMPTDFLIALLDVMRQLTTHYGCTLVLSTATQPALGMRDALPEGLNDVREIVEDPRVLAQALRRVAVRWPDEAPTPYGQIANAMFERKQVLAIVHRREDARRLAELLPDEGCYHLSTRMCAAHRFEILKSIRASLSRDAPCRVVSTQLIEAGVDVSFPVVYRAMAGLDSLAQAAGRCNRNGELIAADGNAAMGEFIVFRAETLPPHGVLRRGMEVADIMLRAHGSLDLTDPELQREYFRSLYFGCQLDRLGVMAARRNFDFATVARLVRFIEEGTHPLIVPWGDADARVRDYEQSLRWSPGKSRRAARGLQPFVVQVRLPELRLLEKQGAVGMIEGFGHQLVPPFMHLYDEKFGLTLDEDAAANPSAMIV
jgi:CRISPR-associated endonuclease/helicase Cas3